MFCTSKQGARVEGQQQVLRSTPVLSSSSGGQSRYAQRQQRLLAGGILQSIAARSNSGMGLGAQSGGSLQPDTVSTGTTSHRPRSAAAKAKPTQRPPFRCGTPAPRYMPPPAPVMSRQQQQTSSRLTEAGTSLQTLVGTEVFARMSSIKSIGSSSVSSQQQQPHLTQRSWPCGCCQETAVTAVAGVKSTDYATHSHFITTHAH